MSIDDPIDGHDDLRAAEYVLGLLDAEGLREAEARLRTDADFAAEVGRWETRFASWLDALAPVEAPAWTWSRIRSSLPDEHPARRIVPPPTRTTTWQSLAIWRGLAFGGLAATAASLALVVFVLRHPAVTPPTPPVTIAPPLAPMAVSLRHDDGSIAYTATLGANGLLVLTPVQVGEDPRAIELWLIPVGDKPHSLGMLPRDRATAVQIPGGLREAARRGLFAISLEPPGSGPHPAPTGPVVAKGGMVEL
jgi:anti-sigma-K factor RskA